jgi:sigma-B regulation protein RsbU (phosphoserine phosphatase)
MPKSNDPDFAEIARRGKAAVRTQINHLVGYCGILGEDALDAEQADLTKRYAAIADLAVGLKGPISARLDGISAEGAAPDAESLDREIYGLLYDLVARVQGAKGAAAALGMKGLAAETERLLDTANSILEIMAAIGDDSSAAAEEEAPRALPQKSAQAAPREPAELDGAPRPGRILVVDDNVFNREILSRHLERQGHSVRVAADGLSALELLRSESFDVAIIDVMMPGMNGYQLLERMRAEEALTRVRPIVISSLDDTQTIARCIQLGAEDYLPREYEPVILKARIESCLEKKRMREEQELYVAALLDAREKLEQELRGGASYVRSLLPRRFSAPGLSLDWDFIPSASLGGDVFGYHGLSRNGEGREDGIPERIAMYLIDVSGHGIEAALFSVTLMNMLKTQSLPGVDFGDPTSVLRGLNASFRMEEQNYLFFTAWYGVWDSSTKSLRYSSAGSPPATLVGPDGSSALLSGGGTIIGVDPEAEYNTSEIPTPSGSSLYVFSDGIFEFRANDGTIFGIDRFERLLVSAAKGGDDGSALSRILACARAECSTARFPDDISIIEARFGGDGR